MKGKSRSWRLTALALFIVSSMSVLLFSSISFTDSVVDVTARTQRIQSALSYDRKALQSYQDVSLKNISSDVLKSPVTVVVESISPAGVTVANPDGVTGTGKPCFIYTPASGTLAPNATTATKRWKFGNPKALRFSYTVSVWAEIQPGNRPPTAEAGPDQSAYVGSTVTLNGTASSDLDGDSLTYLWSPVSVPPGSAAVLSSPTVPRPTFQVDLRGSYTFRLVVNDGKADSTPDTVTVTTQNSPPVANAGAPQTTVVGATVTLNGSGSTDADGDALTYDWSFAGLPSGNTATLSNRTSVSPTFVVDRFGDYVVRLVVNDGTISSTPATVTISTRNSPPVANAGPNRTVAKHTTVTLDGSGSTDVDGNPLTFKWSLTTPPGSTAVLSDPTAVRPTFYADLSGDYIGQLIVSDGLAESTATVTITTTNTAPVANAGPAQTALWGATITLDGSASSDADGDALAYAWSLPHKPAGSTAILSNVSAVHPTFQVDVPGDYVAQLVVNDGTTNSLPSTVSINATNSAPVANPGPDRTVTVGTLVILDGSASSDADGNSLTYKWSFSSKPTGSAAAISAPGAVQPTFTVDLPGDYVIGLIVNDGLVDSAPVTVRISTVNSAPVAEAGPNQTTTQVGNTVTLDGSASSDADGDSLIYKWSFVSKPSGSAAELSNTADIRPTFVVDVFGTYVIQLQVNDGALWSAIDTVTVSTVNSPPVANAGPDQTTIRVGNTVTLDGSLSSDVDGNPLTYQWSLTRPAGSSATISIPTGVRPTFVADVFGTYVAQLIVDDGTVKSAPDTVTISTENSPPVANAGPAQTPRVGDLVTLDGSGSTDVDGDVLTFHWSMINRPAGSAAVLSDPSALKPTFTVDDYGDYVIQLYVVDARGATSNTSTVTISTLNSAPVANAGPDQTVTKKARVFLDGSASSDVDHNALTFAWSFLSPAVNPPVLSNADTDHPSFVADVAGDYVVQLIVNDGALSSAPDTVKITTLNSRPVANPGTAQTVYALETVTLDGSGSYDADGDALTYSWSLTVPVIGSTAVLSDKTSVSPTFVPDLPGDYLAQLIVSDGTLESFPKTVVVTALEAKPSRVTLTPTPSTMSTRDTLTLTATLDVRAGAGGQTVQIAPGNSLVSTPASVVVPQGQTQMSFNITSGNTAGTVEVVPSGTGLTGSNAHVTVQARTFTLSSPLVGLDRTVVGTVNLAQPAPEGGATIAMSVGNTALATISPATVVIPQGSTTGTFELTGKQTIGFTTITADGTANGYVSRTLDITVTNRLIDIPANHEFALGQTYEFTILIAPDAAPAGGVQIALTSSDPSLIEVLTPTVTIPAGSFQATASVRASNSARGTATVTASNAGFAPDRMQATVTTALKLQAFSTFSETESDDLFVLLESGGGLYPAPAGGAPVTLISGNPACVAVNSPFTVPAGVSIGTSALTYGGGAALPCTTTVTANSSLFGSGTVSVTVGRSPDLGAMSVEDISYATYLVGSSLQAQYRVYLPTASHGGVTVQLESNNPFVARVAASADTAGGPITGIFVPNGQNYIDFFVQGVRQATGSATIKARTSRFTDGTTTVQVVQPVLYIGGLNNVTTSLSADNPFYVYTGVLDPSGTSIWFWQNVSGAGPLPVTFTTGDPAVGVVKTSWESGPSVTAQVPVNSYNSPTSVSSGGVAFAPLAEGTSRISAAAPGFNASWNDSYRDVTVSKPGMTIYDVNYGTYRVGSRLQNLYQLNLNASNHGGVTVRVASSNANVARVTVDPNVPGTEFIDLFVPNGESYANFYVQGVPNALGSVSITADNSLFAPASVTVEVVQPILYITRLPNSTSALAADIPFIAQVGILDPSGTNIEAWQYVSGAGPLPVTFTSSNPAAGVLKTSAESGPSVTVLVPVNSTYSPEIVDWGGVAFDPLAEGTTTISATALGFNNLWADSQRNVTVIQPGISVSSASDYTLRVGSRLQAVYSVWVDSVNPDGMTVHITSSAPNIALVSADPEAPGFESIDLLIPGGQSYANFYVQGVADALGSVDITATNPLFAPGSTTLEVVQPVLYIERLPNTTTAFSADSQFLVRLGIPDTYGSSVAAWQFVSGAGPLPVTFTSSNPSVGVLKTSTDSGPSLTLMLPVNSQYSPEILEWGGVAFDPLAEGTTTISATALGFNDLFTDARRDVAVTQPTITISPNSGYNRVGSSLQALYYVGVDSANPDGMTVQIASSNADVALISADPGTAGSGSIDLLIPGGQTYAAFYVQGVADTLGSVGITASNPLFSPGSATVEIVQPVLQIEYLPSTTTTFSAATPFLARVGVAESSGTYIESWQSVSGAGPLPVTFTSGNPSVGVLKTSSESGSSVTLIIPVNNGSTPQYVEWGGVAFDPVAEGTTTVSATAPGFNDLYSNSRQVVTVSETGIDVADICTGTYYLGAGLQCTYRITLGGPDHGGATVRVSSGDTTRMLVSPDVATAGTSFIDLFIPDGQTYADFYVQGISGKTGNVTLTAGSPSFTDGTRTVSIVKPVITIGYLPTATNVSTETQFCVMTGILDPIGTSFWAYQSASAAGPVHVLLTSSNDVVGQFRTAAATGPQVTVDIPVGESYSPGSVGEGGVSFQALTAGTTKVSVYANDFNNSWSGAVTTVTVSP